jgi:DNA-binding GntR family transcriptional regulator
MTTRLVQRVLGQIALDLMAHGRCRRTNSTLAWMAGCSRKTVARALDDLIMRNLIVVRYEYGRSFKSAKNVVRLRSRRRRVILQSGAWK